MNTKMKNTILVVDDDHDVLNATSTVLSRQNYSVISCSSADEAIDSLKGNGIDIVLTDIRMPEVTGIELLGKIHEVKPMIPVILMTAYADLNVAVDAIKKGAFDLIMKPVIPDHLLNSVKKASHQIAYFTLKEQYKYYLEDMVRLRTNELETASKRAESLSSELVRRMTAIAEFRDIEAGEHVSRIGIFSELISRKLLMAPDYVQTIRYASMLHDIGKVGIPDTILFKPGALTHEEFEIIKTHTTKGQRILQDSSHPVIQMAEAIALMHHERWDGSGYPQGLKGSGIPLEGRIVNIVDQYDALRSERPYKKALSHSEVVKIITQGDGRTMPAHFDPDVLKAFVTVSGQFDNMYDSHRNHVSS